MRRDAAWRRWSAELVLAGSCVIWGSTFVLVKNALDDISTSLFLCLRFAIAAVALGAVFLARSGDFRRQSGWLAGVLTGGLLYTGYLLQTIGLRHTTPATSGFITGLYIVIVPLMSAMVYAKLPAASEWAGVLLATAGLGLMTLRPSQLAVGEGELWTVGCAFAFAAHIVALGHFSQRTGAAWLSLLQIATSAVIGFATFWWVEPVFLRWSGALIVALAVTSVLATALAFYLQTWAQARTTPTRTALILSLEPVFAWLSSWLLLGEVLAPRAFAGAACILAGILLVELKPPGAARHPESQV